METIWKSQGARDIWNGILDGTAHLIGMVNELFIESRKDEVADMAYHRVAGQTEFNQLKKTFANDYLTVTMCIYCVAF